MGNCGATLCTRRLQPTAPNGSSCCSIQTSTGPPLFVELCSHAGDCPRRTPASCTKARFEEPWMILSASRSVLSKYTRATDWPMVRALLFGFTRQNRITEECALELLMCPLWPLRGGEDGGLFGLFASFWPRFDAVLCLSDQRCLAEFGSKEAIAAEIVRGTETRTLDAIVIASCGPLLPLTTEIAALLWPLEQNKSIILKCLTTVPSQDV